MFRELLIGVTNFFRDAESFNVLKNDILPKYFDQMKEGEAFRAWIPGCSTGEEVYSLAIILRECLGTNPKGINLQLFGTDIDTLAVDKAREGLYPKSISADVSPERLKRFFVEEGELYRISKEIRDSAVFSVQDVIKDPPFSRLSLLCCRNLLIYLDTEAQKKLIPLFHYTLTADGILVLGSSETVGGYSNLFKTLDKKWKIFRRQEVPRSLYQQIEFPVGESTPQGIIDTNLAAVNHKSNIGSLVQKAVLDELGTTALLVDGKGNILHVQGRTGKYLETPSGPPTQNILDMAREGLRIELSSALRAAKSSNEKVVRRRISVKTNGDVQLIDLHVSPQYAPKELAGRFLVAFEDVENTLPASDQPQDKQGVTKEAKGRIAVLEKELQNTRESHQTTIEELESSNEELKSTNEELQSSNEELQSTNEELESSKEELQSLNEELQTVNSELQSKVEELSSANDDMRNLLNSTEIATIFVDNDMRVRRFTKEATAIINLIETDIGRPLQHVVTNLTYERMIDDLEIVLKNLTPKEIEVQTAEGRWYNMRIVPYRTTDNRIDGAVLTFAYIGDQKAAQELLEKGKDEMSDAWQLLRSVFDMDENLMAVLNKDNKLVVANNNFCELLDIHKDKVFGLDMLAVQDSVLDKAGLGKLLTKSMKANKAFETEACELSISGKKTKIVFKGQVIKRKNVSDYVLLKGIKEGGKGGGNG